MALTPQHTAVLHRMLGAVIPTSTLAHIEEDGRPVAFGMAVVERGTVGFFEMLTLPEVRRHGFATAIVESLLVWAREHGACKATLQVVAANSPCQALYERFGLSTLYDYRYLVGPAGLIQAAGQKRYRLSCSRPVRPGLVLRQEEIRHLAQPFDISARS